MSSLEKMTMLVYYCLLYLIHLIVKERESEYNRYRKDKKHRCKDEFRNLLRETKCITYRYTVLPYCIAIF